MTCKGWRWYLERVLVNIKECSTQLQMSTVNCYVTTAIVTSGHLQPAVTRSGSRRLQPRYVNTAPRVSAVHMHKYFLTFIEYNVRYYWRLERSTDGGLVIRQCVVPHSAGGLTCSDVAYGLAPVQEDARGRGEGAGAGM